MNGRIAVILFFLSFLILQPVVSQDKVIFSKKKNKNFLFYNNHHPDEDLYITSIFINEMALSLGKKKSGIRYTLDYQIKKEITKKNNKYTASIAIISESVQGETYYRYYNISEVLFPSNVSFDVFVFRDNDKLLFHDRYKTVIKEGKANVSFKINASDDDLSIKVEGIRFYYNESARDSFMIKTSLINDYYGTCSIMDSLLLYVKKLDSQIRNYPLQLLWNYFDLQQIIKKFENKTFIASLNIRQRDSLGFSHKLKKLKLKKGRLKTLFDQHVDSKSTTHSRQWQNIQICKPYFDLLDKYIGYARKSDHYFSSSYYNLLERNYTLQEIDQLYQCLSKYINHPENKKFKKKDFSKSFSANYLQIIDSCVMLEYYNEALDLLTGLESFCHLRSNHCNKKKIMAEKARGTVGLYNSFIKIVQRAIRIKNYPLALTYIKQADDFRQRNSEFIISNKAIIRLYELLAESYLEYCITLNSSKQYKTSYRLLNEAKLLKHQYPELSLNRLLLEEQLQLASEGIYQSYLAEASQHFNQGDYPNARKALNLAQQYQSLDKDIQIEGNKQKPDKISNGYPDFVATVSEAESLYMKGKYKESLLKYEEARKQIGNKTNRLNIDSLIKIPALAYKDELIYLINLNLWQKELYEARKNLKALFVMLQKYKLTDEPDIKKETDQLRRRIADKQCDVFWDQYEKSVLEGFNAVDQQNYLLAGDHFMKAIEINKRLSKCGIHDSTAIKAIEKYKKPIYFAQNRQSLEQQLFGEGFKNIISEYLSLDSMYKSDQLSNFGISHVTFRRFLSLQQNPNLFLQSTHYFIEKEKYRKALEILSLLYAMNYPARKTARLQKKLAKKMALIDFNKNKESDFKHLALEYTDNIHQLKYFKRAYKWKILMFRIKDFYKAEKNEKSDK